MIAALILISASANAFDIFKIDSIGTWVQKEIEASHKGLVSLENEHSSYDWTLPTIMIQVSPSISLSIPWIAKATLKPEIEFHWNK